MYTELAVYFLLIFLASLPLFRLFFPAKRQPGKSTVYLQVAFLAYLSALVTLTVIPSERFRLDNTISHFNFMPLINTARRLYTVLSTGYYPGIKNALQNLVGNILLFVPLGFFLAYFYNKTIRQVLVISASASCAIELLQSLHRVLGYFRHVDIDDVLLNISGAMIGYVMKTALMKNRSK
jgi:glycopeptide antibiotics resistance protein